MFRNDIIRVYSEDSSSGWWQLCNRARRGCPAALEGDVVQQGRVRCFPGCRRRREDYLEAESDLHMHLPHADHPNNWHAVLLRHVEATGDCSRNYYLEAQVIKEQ